MTKQELEQYGKLNEKFVSDCERVCKELSRYDGSYDFLDSFILEDDEVYGHGHEWWSYGGHEEHEEYFDAVLLTYSDEELREYVDKRIEEKNKREQEKKDIKEARERELDLKKYNELKEKLGL